MSGRQRAGDVRASMLRGMTVPPRPVPQPVSDDEAVPAAPVEPAGEQQSARPVKSARPAGTTRFTANMDADTAAEFDGLALRARRQLGRKVDKLELLKAFIRLAADDASLRDQLISEVGKTGR